MAQSVSPVIASASEAIHHRYDKQGNWIASSLALLAMTPECDFIDFQIKHTHLRYLATPLRPSDA
jgi:hypothetical protein